MYLGFISYHRFCDWSLVGLDMFCSDFSLRKVMEEVQLSFNKDDWCLFTHQKNALAKYFSKRYLCERFTQINIHKNQKLSATHLISHNVG
jgi:hypothetical protein